MAMNSQLKLSHSKVANALREMIVDKISPILSECDNIYATDTRLLVQSQCLDIVTSIEDIIKDYNLDER